MTRILCTMRLIFDTTACSHSGVLSVVWPSSQYCGRLDGRTRNLHVLGERRRKGSYLERTLPYFPSSARIAGKKVYSQKAFSVRLPKLSINFVNDDIINCRVWGSSLSCEYIVRGMSPMMVTTVVRGEFEIMEFSRVSQMMGTYEKGSGILS